jgi:hypothetical protein
LPARINLTINKLVSARQTQKAEPLSLSDLNNFCLHLCHLAPSFVADSMPVEKGSTPQPNLIQEVLQQCNITEPITDQVKAIILALLTAHKFNIPKVMEQYNVGKKMNILKLIVLHIYKPNSFDSIFFFHF